MGELAFFNEDMVRAHILFACLYMVDQRYDVTYRTSHAIGHILVLTTF